MTNHIHLLATPTDAESINKTFQSASRKYMQYFNYTYRRTGTLWEGRYRATVVDSKRYLLGIMRYIELNPVRAGLVAHPREYPRSSHRRYAYGDTGANFGWLIEPDQNVNIARTDEARRRAYRDLFKLDFDAEMLDSIRASTHKGWALGDDRFKHLIEQLGDRRAVSAAKGRPRKDAKNFV